jgi:lipopolysaccharide export system ATP-binding protein
METVSRLYTENLVKKYKTRTVVNHVSIEVKQGEIVGLLGPNGAGKTTTFYMIVGLIKPNEGRIFFDDINITNYPVYRRAQIGIGYLAQEASVFRRMTVEDNIRAVLEMSKFSKEYQKERLETLLEEFGLNRIRKSLNPKFILLDEPFAGVDPIAVEDIQEVVSRLRQKNIGILITDHNVHETLSITDRAYLLIDGTIFKSGTAEQLSEDEQVRRLYLGKNFELRKPVR